MAPAGAAATDRALDSQAEVDAEPAKAGDPIARAQATWEMASAGGAETAAALTARFALADALGSAGRHEEAEGHWAALSPVVRRLTGKGSSEDVIIQSRRAESLSALGRDARAVAVADPGLALALRRFGPDSLHTERLRLALATAAMRQGRFAEAVPWMEASLDYNVKAGDLTSARVVGDALARAYAALDRSADERGVRIRMAGLGGDAEAMSAEEREQALADAAALARSREAFEAAIEPARELARLRRERLGEADGLTLDADYDLADTLALASGRRLEDPRTTEAEALYRRVMDLRRGPDDRSRIGRARAVDGLGELLTFTSTPGEPRFAEGLALILEALEMAATDLGDGHSTVHSRLIVAAYQLIQAGRTTEAGVLLDRLTAAAAAGHRVSPQMRGMAALIQARLAYASGGRAATYRQVALAADAFRSRAIETGDSAEMRRSLNDWSFLYQTQVMMAWRTAAALSGALSGEACSGHCP